MNLGLPPRSPDPDPEILHAGRKLIIAMARPLMFHAHRRSRSSHVRGYGRPPRQSNSSLP